MNLTAEGVYGKHVFVPRLDPVYATKAQLLFFLLLNGCVGYLSFVYQ